MNFFTRLMRRLQTLFIHNPEISRIFGVDLITSDAMDAAIQRWDSISTGKPPWLNRDDEIDTINLAKLIATTRARLTTLDIGIKISSEGQTARADYLQKAVDDLVKRLPDRVADADRLGGMMIKWNGIGWDFVLPGSFGITAKDSNGNITGAIFAAHTTEGKTHYTRLEYHRFEGDGEQKVYHVSNRAFRNQAGSSPSGQYMLGAPVRLQDVKAWAGIQDEVYISNLEKPLFAFYRVPGSNTIDATSPLGLSVFADALPELKAVDIAISRKNAEVEDSKHITFVGQTVTQAADHRGITLPRFVRGLGIGLNDADTTAVHEHVPTILADQRLRDINFSLSLAGVKCGFSEGVFVLDGQRGVVTATQVESDDRDTIQTIKADRDALQNAIEQAIYGLDAYATLYNLAPMGEFETNFSFGDITYNYEEDKASWRMYVTQGWVPVWQYLMKFEKMSEEEAKQCVMDAREEAAQAMAMQQPGLFPEPE